MRNQFPGKCYRCGEIVEAKAGHFERKRGGWRVQHEVCARVYRGTGVKYEPKPAKRAEIAGGNAP